MAHDFEDIEIKQNAPDLLKKELLKRDKCMIGTGAMTDPYIPIEGKLGHVRKSLELIYRYGFGFTCITKSDLVLRDLDLLKKINEKSKAVVQMTLTTADDGLCRILEPGVCPTSRRVEVLEKLNREGIPTVVWLCPILPYINDDEDNVSKILDYCIDAEVHGILNFGMGMTLREGNREYFYEKLDEHFPGLKNKYIEKFGNSYGLESPNSKKLTDLFYAKTNEHGILNDVDEIFAYLKDFPDKSVQTTLL